MRHRGLVVLLGALTVMSAAWVARAPVGEAAAAEAPRPLPFFYDLFTFRGETPTTTTVIASFAVPLGELESERADWGRRYRFDVVLVLADTALKSVTRTADSVYARLPGSLDADHLLHTHVEVQAPPSGTTVHRVIMTDATTPGIGQMYSEVFPIPDYSGDELMISDIALGLPDAAEGWQRRDATLALIPTSRFPESSFDVYYEIYNLPYADWYDTEVSVARLNREGEVRGDPVTLRFSDESVADEDDVLSELRRVGTSLDRGRYRLTVTVTNQRTGETATQERRFEVRGWGEGVTMVQANPRVWEIAGEGR